VCFKTGPEKLEVLNKSWVLVNTSVSECLPVSFLEAAAHGCAILSFHDPDGFASHFGQHVRDGDLESGLRALLKGDSWREKGEAGRAYVSEVHEVSAVTDKHIEAYRALLGREA
jgi:glycosyltransferase involved in cell wall biosynthesis